MKYLHRSTILFLAISSLTTQSFAGNCDCVEEGNTLDATFNRPSLISGGTPSNAFWAGPNNWGNPQGFDSDVSADDPLGPGTHTGSNTTILTIQNNGGSLSGPNGIVQTGFWEGSCLEVYMTWTYLYEIKVTKCFDLGARVGIQVEDGPVTGGAAGGLGGKTCEESTVYRSTEVRSAIQEICAC